MVFWAWIRQNLPLKIISIVTAVMLYVYVQQERNPTITRSLLLNVEYRNKQDGYQVLPEGQQVRVTVVGPRQIVERLKDEDIKASANLIGIPANQPNSTARVTYSLPKGATDVSLDPVTDFVSVQLFRQKSRKLRVEATFSNQPPAGVRYGERTIHPSLVTIRGREDVVNRVDKILAFASPAEPKGSIDGDFSLVAWDSDHNSVEGVEIDPPKVHVTIPQVMLPAERVVSVQVIQSDSPKAPYRILDIVTVPNQLTIVGELERVNSINGINTETLSVHDFAATKTIEANLILPPDVEVHDRKGKPVKHVKITFVIGKAAGEPARGPDGSTQPSSAKHEGTTPP